jgi:hypothetical protein
MRERGSSRNPQGCREGEEITRTDAKWNFFIINCYLLASPRELDDVRGRPTQSFTHMRHLYPDAKGCDLKLESSRQVEFSSLERPNETGIWTIWVG